MLFSVLGYHKIRIPGQGRSQILINRGNNFSDRSCLKSKRTERLSKLETTEVESLPLNIAKNKKKKELQSSSIVEYL